MADDFEEFLRQAAQPSLEIIEQLSEGTSKGVQAMLSAIGRRFWFPRYSVTRVKKDARVDYRHVTLFRAAVGVSPSRLIRECRMETGMRLLRDTLLKVEEVAILIGYDSKRSLERLCRRWCGLSPADFRTRLRHLKRESVKLPDDVFSWYFWEKYHCNALSDEELGMVIEHLERRCTRSG